MLWLSILGRGWYREDQCILYHTRVLSVRTACLSINKIMLFLGLFACLPWGIPQLNAQETQQETLTLGLPAFWDKETTHQQWQPLADYLSQSLPNAEIRLQVLDLPEFEQALAQETLDFIFINPSLYVLYTYRYGLSSPLATLVNHQHGQDLPHFAGVIFTKASHTHLKTLADLRGQTLAAVAPESLAAYQMQAYELRQIGLYLPQDAHLLWTGLPLQQVVDAVMSGQADAGFIRAGVLESLQAQGQLSAQEVRIIGRIQYPDFPLAASTRLYPNWPFAARRHLDNELSRQVASALLALPWHGEVAQRLHITGFSVPGDYRLIDQLLRELELAPFDQVNLSWRQIWARWQYPLFVAFSLFALFLVISLLWLLRANRNLRLSRASIHKLAYYHPLTHLPNRAYLLESLSTCLQTPDTQQALLLVNLDQFKTINNARGSQFADKVLHLLAQRLVQLSPEKTTLFHVNADEFALLGRLTTPEHLLEALLASFTLDGEVLHLSVSAGLAERACLETLPHAESWLKAASTALSQAKQAGGRQLVVFDPVMAASFQQTFELENELLHALQTQAFELYLQPQVDAQAQVKAAEVLLRWPHPTKGMISPAIFIPIAEKSHLIVDLGWWVVEESLKIAQQVQKWHLMLAINISARHFRQQNFVSHLFDLLNQYQVDPQYMTLEITESLVIDDIQDLVAKMHALKALGFHLSIDDFGTGYSSLAYLKRLPIDELKIDRSFIQDLPADQDAAALVEAILAVADKMRLRVVAEGVETQAQADFLNQRAQLLHQGYLFARPQSAQAWLKIWRATEQGSPKALG